MNKEITNLFQFPKDQLKDRSPVIDAGGVAQFQFPKDQLKGAWLSRRGQYF